MFNSANFEKGVGVKPGSSNYPMTNRIKGISKQTINEKTYYTSRVVTPEDRGRISPTTTPGRIRGDPQYTSVNVGISA